jgi:hypothetical protein
MIQKVLIPLEDVKFRGIDNKVRLRYRLVSKDRNESSQWSPVYTVNPSEIKSELLFDPGYETTNPILYSKWEPTSYSDGKNINIKIDSGWVKDKKVIPCNNFDIFITWNQFYSTTNGFWGYQIAKDGNVIGTSIVATTSSIPGGTQYTYTATVTDIPTKNLNVGDSISAKDGTGSIGQSSPSTSTTVSKIYGPYSMQVTTDSELVDVPITGGTITNLVKLRIDTDTVSDDFIYAGTTDSGNLSIKIQQQAYSQDDSVQYSYMITPATNPPTLVETFDGVDLIYTNALYKSDILTTAATVEPGATGNTYNIDSGSPT